MNKNNQGVLYAANRQRKASANYMYTAWLVKSFPDILAIEIM